MGGAVAGFGVRNFNSDLTFSDAYQHCVSYEPSTGPHDGLSLLADVFVDTEVSLGTKLLEIVHWLDQLCHLAEHLAAISQADILDSRFHPFKLLGRIKDGIKSQHRWRSHRSEAYDAREPK